MTNISPKVSAQVITTIVLGSLVAGIGAVTPGMLAFLGGFAPVAFAVITALGSGLVGWLASDPLREAGNSALSVHQSIAAATPLQGADHVAAAKSAEFDQIVAPATPAEAAPVDSAASVVVPLERPTEAPIVGATA